MIVLYIQEIEMVIVIIVNVLMAMLMMQVRTRLLRSRLTHSAAALSLRNTLVQEEVLYLESTSCTRR